MVESGEKRFGAGNNESVPELHDGTNKQWRIFETKIANAN
jgi:hypothetical protein